MILTTADRFAVFTTVKEMICHSTLKFFLKEDDILELIKVIKNIPCKLMKNSTFVFCVFFPDQTCGVSVSVCVCVCVHAETCFYHILLLTKSLGYLFSPPNCSIFLLKST